MLAYLAVSCENENASPFIDNVRYVVETVGKCCEAVAQVVDIDRVEIL